VLQSGTRDEAEEALEQEEIVVRNEQRSSRGGREQWAFAQGDREMEHSEAATRDDDIRSRSRSRTQARNFDFSQTYSQRLVIFRFSIHSHPNVSSCHELFYHLDEGLDFYK